MERRSREVVNCPHCGSENPWAGETCLACSKGLTVYIGPASALPRKFGLGPLMVLVAVIAVGLGTVRLEPFLGAIMLIVMIPATIRTVVVASQRIEDQRSMTIEEKSWVFFTSAGLMIAVLVSSFLAFVAVCLPIGAVISGTNGYVFVAAIAVSSCVGLFVAYKMLSRFWTYRG